MSLRCCRPRRRQAVEGSLAGALGTAQQLSESGNGAQAQQLIDTAKDAWAHGLQLSMTIGAVIVVVAAVICAKYLPGRGDAVATDDAVRRVGRPRVAAD